MKFQRTSLALVLAALALGGFVYYTESKKPAQIDEAKADEKPLFNFKEQEIQAFTVKTPKQTLEFEKAPIWTLRKPEVAPANESSIAFLLNLLTAGKSDRTFNVPAARKSEFGLDQPSATVDVKLSNQKNHRLVIGKPNFNRNFLYALVDPPADINQDLSVLLVPINFQNAVDRPLSEWKRDQPKPSPSVTPTASPQ
ncbi:DUF4340 domain-containing protein [Cyanobacteria bacterium FACHB-DQ100]|uniref:DUF4340 domain-containing protein n=1 Tax=unclassified Leptolyngbya TaxID=2650499 RepID=UPI0016815D41|nr:DUF4340 domain-containing protein [Leptolyngbya sp. FACHB-17]MBD1821045.1 DUF4340 domain-containing protein [Cyanobacteria bacterium FACHB-DQ100]MBD2079469.1 DUF4340 domain-containing protein [Leptolyngbya sp. FACHB-17]